MTLTQEDLQAIASLVDSKIDTISHQMNDGFETLNQRIDMINEKVEKVDQKVTKTNLTIENDLSKKIDIIGEGHDFLKQRLDEALQMEKKRESMELELINLRMEIKKIKEHLDIA